MNIKRFSLKWHSKLAWYGAAAVFIWALSGLLHPLMSWFGPQAQSFYPPKMVLSPTQLAQFPALMQQANIIERSLVAKLVPSRNGPLLQLTQSELTPRLYYQLATGKEVVGQDAEQAIWLGEHYLAKAVNDLLSIDFLTEFDVNYPAVNRLLPVYKLVYNDGQTAYFHTETMALASLSDNKKALMQVLFQQLHTFKWLSDFEWGRVIIIALLMLTLFLFASTGLALVVVLKQRKIKAQSRQYHRLLAYILWLPLLGWSISGFYHLLQSSTVEPISGLRLGQPLALTQVLSADFTWLDKLQNTQINALSVVKGDNGDLMYRLSVATTESAAFSREAKFAGKTKEKQALYINAYTGKEQESLPHREFDKKQAQYLASQFSDITLSDIVETELVTHFSPNYDFRNKRLPVWQLTLNDNENRILFIDPTTGVLVDQSRMIDRAERWSFSLLHKWSHLTPVTGRFYRDVFIVFILFLLILTTAFGIKMLVKVKKKKANESAITKNPVLEELTEARSN